ncbi:hypothetical protein K438DRAFT_1814688 [Mycena galopus ATCC 62051]|nr:hypothetical protein K438DRAFT_1814688 [Mycena galopus ATCC 62051]
MKVSFIPLALTCTGLVASATPLRVIVVSNGANVPDNGPVAHMMAPQRPRNGAKGADGVSFHAPCGGARFRQKVTSLADSFKIALGFQIAPPKPTTYKSLSNQIHPSPPPNAQKLAPLPWVGVPPRFEGKTGPKEVYWGHKAEHDAEHPHHRHQGHGRFRFRHHERGSFLMRVHFALMSLGVWEGRAVAFVLGCGIGVLLRMFWVISVLAFRAIRGPSSSSSSHEYTVLSFEDADAEEIFVAPPTYTYPVEKTTEAHSAPVPVVVITAAPAEEEEKQQL